MQKGRPPELTDEELERYIKKYFTLPLTAITAVINSEKKRRERSFLLHGLRKSQKVGLRYWCHILNTYTHGYYICCGDASMPTIRVRDSDYERLMRVKEYITKNGTKGLEGLREICPKCGALMDGLRISAKYVRCPKCGYTEKGVDLVGVGVGVFIGFALGALMTYLLMKEKRKKGKGNRLGDRYGR